MIQKEVLMHMIVYNLMPNGIERKRGMVEIVDVFGKTSRAAIMVQDDYIVKGDMFVTQDQWEFYQKGK